MIDVSLVTERFLLLSSVSQADEKIQAICQTSVNRIGSLLKETADETDDRVINAAACEAFYHWTLLKRALDEDALKSFRAGDITVENDCEREVEAAYKLREDALDSINCLLDDRDFYFGEVSVDYVRPIV